ncbi:hypothetical protein Tdes44962_MAKER08950 [Teratosphaeria destructans]|uniref:Uncharacterized protein n=1 Tax=Teratosphaeria destructans TaxID=418781 RepID=A0A9W7SVH3_9PEZI|nr:hypothetical protein Tdes44962_MAKER08950 [Teratosphaeria destructans]
MATKSKSKRSKNHATKTTEEPRKPQDPPCLLALSAELTLTIYDEVKTEIEVRSGSTEAFRPADISLGLL